MATQHLVLCYPADGHLAHAMTLADYNRGVEFPPGPWSDQDVEEVCAWHVPDAIADRLLTGGYANPREAAQAALPYLD